MTVGGSQDCDSSEAASLHVALSLLVQVWTTHMQFKFSIVSPRLLILCLSTVCHFVFSSGFFPRMVQVQVVRVFGVPLTVRSPFLKYPRCAWCGSCRQAAANTEIQNFPC